MPISPDSLPDDIAALKDLLLARGGEVEKRRTTVSTLEQALSVRGLEIEQLKLQLAKLKRMQFGRKSEKLDRKIEQLETRLEDLVAEEGASEQQGAPAAPRRKSERLPLPEHLDREERVLDPQEQACAQCGGELKPLGEDVSEQLEIIDSAFKVVRHIRRKKACACCDHITQAAAPSRPIERGMAGPGLLAQILVAKFADHQPLYRQSAIYARHGVQLDRSTMARWVGACVALMRPLVAALQAYVLQPGKIHSDDTPHARALTGQWPNQDRPPVGLCARRPAFRFHRSAGGVVRVHAKPPGPASAGAFSQFQRRAPGGRLRRL
jgi:transposase